jgi:hydrogenase-4 component F
VLAVVQGTPRSDLPATDFRDRIGTVGPPLLLMLLVLVLGLYVPPVLDTALRDAAAFVEGGR